jgi:hypothetical protein
VISSREAVLIIFRFEAPDGYKESVYVSLSPAGTVVLRDLLEKELESYVKRFGNIVSGEWRQGNPNDNKKDDNNHTSYLS